MKYTLRLIIFLTLNLGVLALGSLYTTDGVQSDWYDQLNKAPWTPPGWVFGAAWTTIMIMFSFFMAQSSTWVLPFNFKNKLIGLYWPQLILNFSWNPVFFYNHLSWWGLLVISALLILVISLFIHSRKMHIGHRLLIVPYIIWLVLATSLNAYITFMN